MSWSAIPARTNTGKAKESAPVVFETHPTYRNLFGRIEYNAEMGALVTSYRQICSGALHQANGGFLVLEAARLLEEPFVWEALKRALKEKELKIESPASEMGLLNTITLNPEVIPLNVKIILIGSRQIYYLLQELDPDFTRCSVCWSTLMATLSARRRPCTPSPACCTPAPPMRNIPPLTAQAVARMVEQSSRMAEHKRHLSAHIGDLFDLLAEADYIRRESNNRKITHLHINKALEAKAERTNRVSKAILKEMIEGSVLIDTDGEAIGKINGLTVLSIGDTSFGSPARITAAVYPGSQGIVDIEREVQLGQAIHSKGVMILTGYLGSTYAQKFPLAISASLAMEQSYGYIDGDSASMAELCCLISALTNVPIKQSFAITGSMNQHGEVQAIGGVNEKIECFFDLCEARGLTGGQGVIIPAANVRNLMLNEKVLEAVKQGKFAVYAVSHVEEALEILTGLKPGALNSKGQIPQEQPERTGHEATDGDSRPLQGSQLNPAPPRSKPKSLDPHSHRGSGYPLSLQVQRSMPSISSRIWVNSSIARPKAGANRLLRSFLRLSIQLTHDIRQGMGPDDKTGTFDTVGQIDNIRALVAATASCSSRISCCVVSRN